MSGNQKKLVVIFENVFFSSWFPEILSGMPTQSELCLMWIKKKKKNHLVIKYLEKKGEKGNIGQKKYVLFFFAVLFKDFKIWNLSQKI